MHARNFTTNVPKILDLKSSSEQIFFRKLSLGAPGRCSFLSTFEHICSLSIVLFSLTWYIFCKSNYPSVEALKRSRCCCFFFL